MTLRGVMLTWRWNWRAAHVILHRQTRHWIVWVRDLFFEDVPQRLIAPEVPEVPEAPVLPANGVRRIRPFREFGCPRCGHRLAIYNAHCDIEMGVWHMDCWASCHYRFDIPIQYR